MGKPSQEDREGIIRVVTRKMPLAEDVRVEALAERMEGRSGAEVKFLCMEAGILAMQDATNSDQTVKQAHFERALSSLR